MLCSRFSPVSFTPPIPAVSQINQPTAPPDNLLEVLKFSTDVRDKVLYKRFTSDPAVSLWFEGMEYMAQSLIREAGHDHDDITLDSTGEASDDGAH